MFEKTHTECAPWHVIPADSKRYARVQVLKTVNEAIEENMKKWGIDLPSETPTSRPWRRGFLPAASMPPAFSKLRCSV